MRRWNRAEMAQSALISLSAGCRSISDAETISAPQSSCLFALFNLIILAGWRYDWRWSNIPTQVDAERALTHVCTPITATHTNEHGWPWRSEPMELPSAPIKGCWLLPACQNSYKSAQVFINYLHLWSFSFLTQAAHTISDWRWHKCVCFALITCIQTILRHIHTSRSHHT